MTAMTAPIRKFDTTDAEGRRHTVYGAVIRESDYTTTFHILADRSGNYEVGKRITLNLQGHHTDWRARFVNGKFVETYK